MPGIDPSVITHHLNVSQSYKPVLRVQSNQDGRGRLGENVLYHKPMPVLLHGNAFWFEKCKSHLSKASQPYVRPQIGQNVEVYVDDILVKSEM